MPDETAELIASLYAQMAEVLAEIEDAQNRLQNITEALAEAEHKADLANRVGITRVIGGVDPITPLLPEE